MKTANINQGGKKGGKTVGIAILIVVILALVGVIVYLLISRQPKEEEQRNVVITPDNVEEVLEQMTEQGQEPVPAGYYTVTMNYEWHFPAGDAVSTDAYVENITENTN